MTGDGLFGELLAWTGLGTPADETMGPATDGPATSGPRYPRTPPPWPFDEPPEPEAAAPEPAVPFIPTPLPFSPTRHTFGPAPEPPRLAPEPAPAPEAGPQKAFVPPPWPFESPAAPAAPRVARQRPVAMPEPFVPTPLPFAPTRHTFEPAPAPVIVMPEPAGPARPRFGQMHAEATARASRFVAAQQAAGPLRRNGTRNGNGNGNGTDPLAALGAGLSPRGAAVLRATQSYGASPFPAPAPQAQTASNLRQEAIERALARGRALAGDPQQRPAPQSSTVSSDQIGLVAALAFVLLIEVVGGVLVLGIGAGYPILAFGFALDACTRMLGTIAASRSGNEWGDGWRWACALIGSPAVVSFAFQNDGSLADGDLAPLAGPIAAVAIICIVAGLAGIPAGI